MKNPTQPAPQLLGGNLYSGKEELLATTLLRKYNTHICALIAKNIPLNNKPICMLDFGAGYGILADIMIQHGVVTCIEIDPDLASHLRQKHHVSESLAEISNNSIHFIYSSNVLEHIKDDETTLKQLFGKLKKEGLLCLYLPAFDIIWSKMDERVGHHRRYSSQLIQKKLHDAGFQVKHWQYVDCLGFFATLIFKLLGSKNGEASTRSLQIYDKFLFPISTKLDHLFKNRIGKNIFIVAQKN